MPGPAARALLELLQVMARLRDPQQGCPWDLAQDFASIAPHTLEEAFEVADAIERGEPDAIRDELGDLLFQVVFHARLGEERGWFDFAAVAGGITAKLRRRHPHVFATAGQQERPGAGAPVADWERIKAAERGAAGEVGTLQGIALALPALTRAAKLGKRASRVGFDWPDAAGVRDKVHEELAEVDEVLAAEAPAARRAEELGDLLFAIANWSRHLGIDAESALRTANQKFERRFAIMEALARERGLALESLSAVAWDALWVEAKRGG
ncbi:MAG: nucleoside triphosphate pyrophosphohydrolase [Gammaproteobacteria bacterium]|nr:nucleoside triphosphate pyrophosphohydrolase [Gammaproteobacteria bacterium]